MRTPVTFTPTKNPRLSDKTPFQPVAGFIVAYGLAIHPAVDRPLRRDRGYWDVSDPKSGALVAYGVYPGPEGAVAALVEVAMNMKHRSGGFRGALERARAKLRAEVSQ